MGEKESGGEGEWGIRRVENREKESHLPLREGLKVPCRDLMERLKDYFLSLKAFSGRLTQSHGERKSSLSVTPFFRLT